jgi:hypothetical protein
MKAPAGSKESYKSVSQFAKDVNRIFSNVLKVWNSGQDIAEASRRLQGWWVDEWGQLVPKLMSMKQQLGKNIDTDDAASKDNIDQNHSDCQRGEDFQEQIGLPGRVIFCKRIPISCT